ncbi:uncharacterized protein LOC114274678 [Camellia sinensis]|uniref:uncharacterized protein LOC114274678 n=1 Tax=Camellia sinensis TaxID=4442 RepID=UPI0010365940|nr:uncharacterized protein LOC114274678 [Camellia sinensis]
MAAIQRTIDIVNQRMAAHDEVIADLRCLSGASASTIDPIPTAQPNPDLPPPVENPQIPNPQEGELPPFDINDDVAMIKIAKLDKALKKSQGFNSIPEIEDGYIEGSVRLLEKFKMPNIDRFNGSGDSIVHVRLFSDVLKPMGFSHAQKLSLFGRTLSNVAAIWYAKLEDSTKQNWEELSKGFVNQYSYNTQIEVTISELEVTTQNPKETFIDFVARWRAKAARMTNRPSERSKPG